MANNTSSVAKYRVIIFTTVVFFLFSVSVFAVNYYLSSQFAQKSKTVVLANKQVFLLQEVARNIATLEQGATEEQTELDALQKNREEFSQLLDAFAYGGSIKDDSGQMIKVAKQEDADSTILIQDIQYVWRDYQIAITRVLQPPENVEDDFLGQLVEFGREHDTSLLDDAREFTVGLQQEVSKISQLSRYVQMGGIVGAILLLIYMIFRIIRQLVRTDTELEEARRETNDIMQTVNEGLFLIDENLIIGGQYSTELENILSTSNIANTPLDILLERFVTKQDVDITREYIAQLFRERIKERLIKDLNPLDQVKVFINDRQGRILTRYLRFNFSRVYGNDRISKVLVSVANISKEVELEQKLELERQQNDEQIDMLTMILRLNPKALSSYLSKTKISCDKINDILESRKRSLGDLQGKAIAIAREAHTLKGEASALELNSFVNILEDFEAKISKLRMVPKITGDDFLPLAVSLEALIVMREKVEELFIRIGGLDLQPMPAVATESHSELKKVKESSYLNEYFTKLAKQIAKRNGKEVDVEISGLMDYLSADKEETIKDITTQLVRNAVRHGIEIPSKRQELGKSEQGLVSIELKPIDDYELELVVEDDGKGIDFDAIRARIVNEKEGYSPEMVATISQTDLLREIFSIGFSTAEEANEDAGQGVGMDIVKMGAQVLKGQISINSKQDKFTRFIIRFPR